MKEEIRPRKGAKKQFFGCVLLFVGLLDAMLALKAGLGPNPFIYILMLSGAALLFTGIWQGRRD